MEVPSSPNPGRLLVPLAPWVATLPLVALVAVDLVLVPEVEAEELIPLPKMMLRPRWYRVGEPSVAVSEPSFPLPFGTPPQSSSRWDVGPTQAAEAAPVVDVHPWA